MNPKEKLDAIIVAVKLINHKTRVGQHEIKLELPNATYTILINEKDKQEWYTWSTYSHYNSLWVKSESKKLFTIEEKLNFLRKIEKQILKE